jgi:dTDP-4-dehydrorhamnose reductase
VDLDGCEAKPFEAVRANSLATAAIARFCHDAGIYLVFPSTDHVFDGSEVTHSEDSIRRPVQVYGLTKCAAEDSVLCLEQASVVRLPLLYDLGESPRGFVRRLQDQVSADGWAGLDNQIIRVPTHVDDAAGALLQIARERPEGGIVHYTGNEEMTKIALTKRIFAKYGDVDSLRPVPHSGIARRPSRIRLTQVSEASLQLETPRRLDQVLEESGDGQAGR